MKSILRAGIASACALALVACGGYASVSPAANANANANITTNAPTIPELLALEYVAPLCSAPAPGQVHCNGFSYTSQGLKAIPHRIGTAASERRSTLGAAPSGLGPSDLQTFYSLTTASATLGTGKTVAVVVYGNTQENESYLAAYRLQYGLPACTTGNGCYKRLDENGGTNYPANGGWEPEAALDTQIISAICPLCNITLLEAATPTMPDLGTAVNTAAALHVSAISNSYGIAETGMQAYASSFNHPGIPITAAAGNGGFSTIQEVPAAYSTVIAVGGTISYPIVYGSDLSNRESAYTATSGCSTITAKPAWQHDAGCTSRTVADIAFLAEDIAEYDGGWIVTSGSSVAAPAIAALYAMTGTAANDASGLYANAAQLHDVVDGGSALISGGQCLPPVNGSTAVVNFFSTNRRVASAPQYPEYLCSGQVGYDAATGNGTPNGVTAFSATAPLPTPLPSTCPSAGGTPNPHPTENLNAGNGCGSS